MHGARANDEGIGVIAEFTASTDIVTVATRRSTIGRNPDEPNLLDILPAGRYTLSPNAAGCYTAEDAVRTCRLAWELLDGHGLVKLEVLCDEKISFFDVAQTPQAAETLIGRTRVFSRLMAEEAAPQTASDPTRFPATRAAPGQGGRSPACQRRLGDYAENM